MLLLATLAAASRAVCLVGAGVRLLPGTFPGLPDRRHRGFGLRAGGSPPSLSSKLRRAPARAMGRAALRSLRAHPRPPFLFPAVYERSPPRSGG